MFDRDRFPLIAVVRNFDEDMPLVVGVIIVAINYSHCVVKLDAVLKSKTTSGKAAEPPSVFNLHTDSSWDFDCLARLKNKRDSFASLVIDESKPVTREQFNRIFKVHQEYESIIESNGMTNGEVDIALSIIKESYEKHMRNHTFVEDARGYPTPK